MLVQLVVAISSGNVANMYHMVWLLRLDLLFVFCLNAGLYVPYHCSLDVVNDIQPVKT